MINEERIRRMTKLAIFDEGIGRRVLPMGKYLKEDYNSLVIIRSFFLGSVSFALLFALYILVKIANNALELDSTSLKQLAFWTVGLYIGFMIVYIVICFAIFHRRYRQNREKIHAYRQQMKELAEVYAREEKERREATIAGGRLGKSLLQEIRKEDIY